MADADLDQLRRSAGVGPEDSMSFSPLQRLADELIVEAWEGVPPDYREMIVLLSRIETRMQLAKALENPALDELRRHWFAAVQTVTCYRVYALPMLGAWAALNTEATRPVQVAGLCLACVAVPLEEEFRIHILPLDECRSRQGLRLTAENAQKVDSEVFRDHRDLVEDTILGHLETAEFVARIQRIRRGESSRVRFLDNYLSVLVDGKPFVNTEEQAAILRALDTNRQEGGSGLSKDALVAAIGEQGIALSDEDESAPVGRLLRSHPAWGGGQQSILRTSKRGNWSLYFLDLSDEAVDEFIVWRRKLTTGSGRRRKPVSPDKRGTLADPTDLTEAE